MVSYGVLWAGTGIDQDIPATYTPRTEDLDPDATFHGLQPPHLTAADQSAFEHAWRQASNDPDTFMFLPPVFDILAVKD